MALQVCDRLIKPLRNNFVERPWGGTKIREFKRMCPLPEQIAIGGAGLGEAFEISAYDLDAEAVRFPSRIPVGDGSFISLAELLHQHAEDVLGVDFIARRGRCFPLLPKYLDIRELLSVQGHPAGNTEAYIVVDVEPGATIRLGFNQDVDRSWLRALLTDGRQKQSTLLTLLDIEADIHALQRVLARWLADRASADDAEAIDMGAWVASRHDRARAARLLIELKEVYWTVLDLMNEVELQAGQVIHNANPARITEVSGRPAAAEVHALGNPKGLEIIALEVRKPGPTLRAWDNVRFPLRDIDIEGALDVLNLRRTECGEFCVERMPVAGREGVMVSVDSEHFRIEHLLPTGARPIDVPAEDPHCLHALKGRTRFENDGGVPIGGLDAGESALVPIGVGAYRAISLGEASEIVKVSLPRA